MRISVYLRIPHHQTAQKHRSYKDTIHSYGTMAEAPQESLRKHRQTLLPQNGAQLSSKKSYGNLLTPDTTDILSVAQKDKDKV